MQRTRAQGYQNITSAGGSASTIRRRDHLRDLAVGLVATATASRGPGEVGDGDDEEAVGAVQDTGQSVVPSSEGSQQTEETTSLLDLGVGGAVHALEVGDTQQQEGQVQEEEEQEEGHGRAQGAEDHEGGEDEPALGAVSILGCARRVLGRVGWSFS